MKFIAHRGNLTGPNKDKENTPNAIIESIEKNFDVEIDVWFIEDKIFLGHDTPQYEIDINFLLKYSDKLWCHCKNVEAMSFLCQYNLHCFSHDKDLHIFTNRGIIWSYPSNIYNKNAITVLPEWFTDKLNPYTEFNKLAEQLPLGICSDYIDLYRKNY